MRTEAGPWLADEGRVEWVECVVTRLSSVSKQMRDHNEACNQDRRPNYHLHDLRTSWKSSCHDMWCAVCVPYVYEERNIYDADCVSHNACQIQRGIGNVGYSRVCVWRIWWVVDVHSNWQCRRFYEHSVIELFSYKFLVFVDHRSRQLSAVTHHSLS